jgi:hypothetical protein
MEVRREEALALRLCLAAANDRSRSRGRRLDRNTRGAGFVRDMEKYNRAAVLGWRLLRVTPDKLVSFGTFEMLRQIFCLRDQQPQAS